MGIMLVKPWRRKVGLDPDVTGSEILMELAGGPPDPRKGLNPKVVEAYTKYVPFLVRAQVTDETESDTFYHDTNPDHFQKHSKSYPPYHTGLN
jgi:hypothetical protein